MITAIILKSKKLVSLTYLSEKGIDVKKNFRCLNPMHEDKHPSMSYDTNRNRVHCFSCGSDYDMFDIIGIEYNLNDNKEIFKKAFDLYIYDKTTVKVEPSSLTGYFAECHRRIGETDYPRTRGLSDEILNRFNIGYDPNYTQGTNKPWKALIIPTGKENYVARNTDPNADSKNRLPQT